MTALRYHYTGYYGSLTVGKRSGHIIHVVVICLVVITLIGLSLAEVMTRGLKSSIADAQRDQALAAADAGVDRAVWNCQNQGIRWWRSGKSGTLAGTIPNVNASYNVTMTADTSGRFPGGYDITSTGTREEETVTVKAVVTGVNANVWANLLFALREQDPAKESDGDSTIAGSVHLEADDVTDPGKLVLGGSGTIGIFDNYVDARGGVAIGEFPGTAAPDHEITPGSGSPHDLEAYFRARTGQVKAGPQDIGEDSASGPEDKGPLAGSFTGTGFGLTGVASFVGTTPVADRVGDYDLNGGGVSFPDMVNPVTINGVRYNDYFDFLQGSNSSGANALKYTANNGDLVITSSSSLNVSDLSGNSLVVAGGVLTIHGVIWAQGSVSISGVSYKGSGVIVSGGERQGSGGAAGGESIVNGKDITVSHLMPVGDYDDQDGTHGFPNNVLSLMSMHNLTIGTGDGDHSMAVCFAENEVSAPYTQCDFAGSIVCKDFDLFHSNHFFAVPELQFHLPLGLPEISLSIAFPGAQVVNYYQP